MFEDKQAFKQLHDKERIELMESILDASVVGLMFVDANSTITYVNRSFEEIHLIRAKDAIGRHVTEVAKTGIAEESELQVEGSRRYIVSRIRIRPAKYTVDGGTRGMREVFRNELLLPRQRA
jgi:PAS domain S-box-containing protein